VADDAQANKAVRVRVEGLVQGVWFRAWTAEQAGRLSLRGWVRNRRDGSVEALFVGPAAPVDEMTALCRRGPAAAQVSKVVVGEALDDGAAGFRTLATE
jgi:acylphosphatase